MLQDAAAASSQPAMVSIVATHPVPQAPVMSAPVSQAQAQVPVAQVLVPVAQVVRQPVPMPAAQPAGVAMPQPQQMYPSLGQQASGRFVYQPVNQ